MYWTLFKNDLKNNRLQSFNIAFFIILAVAFLSVAGQLVVHLNDSVQTMLEKAETPHLLQMHTGEVDQERMQAFVKAQPEIQEYQLLEFLNIDQSLIAINGASLKDFVYDNGFSVQSPEFDYLLDLKGDKIVPKAGEVYVPVFYQSVGIVKEGDLLTVYDHTLEVKGFVRDSQMNSSLSISKRFIISEKDYYAIAEWGTVEYLIEFRLHDVKDISKIESAYAAANLESNGPPFLSYTLFKLVNAFSDGITIVVLLLIGLLLIAIALLCIRFTLLAKLEEDYKEVVVLKAIGISATEIRLLFLVKYLIIAGFSAIVGFLCSFLLKRPFLANMKMFFGEVDENGWTYAVALALSGMVFLLMYLYMNSLANKLKQIKVHEVSTVETGTFIHSLATLPKTLQLIISDFFARTKMYITLVVVFVLAVFILTIPRSIYSTISDKSFVNYLGLGVYDVRVDIKNSADNETVLNALLDDLQNNSEVEMFERYTAKLLNYKNANGTRQKLWVDSGDHSRFPIQYISGSEPLEKQEIALSKLAADELEKKEGDSVTLVIGEEEKTFVVSGIFSDLTNGGKTAKTSSTLEQEDNTWTVIPIRLRNGEPVENFIAEYSQRYSFAKFADTETYLQQIFGNTIALVKNITKAAFIASLFLIFLIVSLFVRMMYLKDRGQHAVLKAVGFSNRALFMQYMLKSSVSLGVGILIGNLFVWGVGDRVAGALLSLIGVHGVHFVINRLFTYVFVPISMLLFAMVATAVGTQGLHKMNIADLLKEDWTQ